MTTQTLQSTSLALVAFVAVIAGCAGSALAGPGHDAPAPSGDPRLEFLKRLAGSWREAGDGPAFEFRVTAAGHAVQEREMIGTPMEMLTVYAMDGAELVATHFCMLGNQPRLVAAKRIADQTLRFGCAGTPGNARSHDDEHVHEWTMRLAEDGSLHYDVQIVKQGVVTEAPSMVLVRR